MRAWILVGLAVFLVLFVAGVLITALPSYRAAAEQEACKNNLKDLAFFATLHAHPDAAPGVATRQEIPAGTIPLPGIAPDERLSWVVDALPTMDQRRQKAPEIFEHLDAAQPWSFPKNQDAAKRKLPGLLCPGRLPELPANKPMPTQYVGIAGLGVDAATLNFVPPAAAPPRAGCFRYDLPTPFSSITDGLSQSLLFGERWEDLGPWLRGGPATVRGLDDRPDAPPLIGSQFGGNHPNASNWAMSDGSIRVFTPRGNPKVLFSLATIAGKEQDAIPGE